MMKPTIFLEGQSDLAILRAVLPPDLLNACDLKPIAGQSTIVSVARTHLIRHHAPTAILIDTDTMDPATIAELVQTTRYLMGAVAGKTPFDVIYCIPEIETIFFVDTAPLQRIFPQFEDVYFLQFASTQPKKQLEVLFQRGGGPPDLRALLDQLASEEIDRLRSTYPIAHVIGFITNNTQVGASKP
jgi:hypothetical protein